MSINKNIILNKIESLEKDKSNTNFWNISYEQGLFLSNFIGLNNPNNILELGTSNGYSTLWMSLELAKTSNITTVEVDLDRFNIAKNNFNDCNIHNIKQLNGEIIELLNDPGTFENKFDLVFLDAAHKKYSEVIDLLINNKIIAENFVIICDNILSHSYMGEFQKKMEVLFDCELISIGSGFLLIRPFSK